MNLRMFLEKLIRLFNIIWYCLNGNQEEDDGKLILELLDIVFELYIPFNKYSLVVNLLIILEIIGNIMNQKDLLSICTLCYPTISYCITTRYFDDFCKLIEQLHSISSKHQDIKHTGYLKLGMLQLLASSLGIYLLFIIVAPWSYEPNYYYFFQTWMNNKYLLCLSYLSVFLFLTTWTIAPLGVMSLSLIFLRLQIIKFEKIFNDMTNSRSKKTKKYQIRVKKVLKLCYGDLTCIKRFILQFSNIVSTAVLGLFTVGCGLFTISLSYVIKNQEIINLIRPVMTMMISVPYAVSYIIMGQLMSNQFEKFYMSLLKSSWTRWNNDNQKFFVMFLLVAQKKDGINFMNMLHVDNSLLLQFFNRIYAATSFYLNLRK